MTTLTSISEIVSFYNILIGPVTSFKELQGRMLSKIVYNEDNEIHFHLTDTHYVSMHHDQDCCECVYIEDIVGDLDDLIGTTLLLVEEVNNYEPSNAEEDDKEEDEYDYIDESETWTYYRFSTEKGDVSIRWYGSSNGYYSESVDIKIINQ
tara:strand:+ start:284 stop:736 length:453 start_codon:yes stop_codon:yes gene_type:complete